MMSMEGDDSRSVVVVVGDGDDLWNGMDVEHELVQ